MWSHTHHNSACNRAVSGLGDAGGRIDFLVGVQQIKFHPRNVMPGAVLPSDTAEKTDLLETEDTVKAVAGLIGLGDSGECPTVAAFGKPAQQLRV
jgi:hypothetical protein